LTCKSVTQYGLLGVKTAAIMLKIQGATLQNSEPGTQDLCTLSYSFTQSAFQDQLCIAVYVDVPFVVKITQNA
jgi:hypothetical protein